MAKFLKSLRNNWKKSVFAAGLLAYGCDYGYTEYKKNLLMRAYCKKALKFGETPIEVFESPRHVVVILNPASNKRKAKKEYEKYCAPLLHLSGANVTLLTTDEKNDAVRLASNIPQKAHAVIIAGGDGTVSDVVTGLLRRLNADPTSDSLPVGIIPLGKNNSLAKKLFGDEEIAKDRLKRLQIMLKATYSIVNEVTTKISAMEIENIDFSDSEKKFLPTYAVHHLQAGAFGDAHSKADKYWYFGKFRSYASYLLGSYDFDGPVRVELNVTPPCTGCSKCFTCRLDLFQRKPKESKRRWWHVFVPRTSSANVGVIPVTDYSKIENPVCGESTEMCSKSIELCVSPAVINAVPLLRVRIGPKKMSYTNFVLEGWNRLNNDNCINDEKMAQIIDAQSVILSPCEPNTEKESWVYIDNEEYEFKRIKIKLLHNILSVFILPDEDVIKI